MINQIKVSSENRGTLEPRFEVCDDWLFQPSLKLLCPVCGFSYQHHGDVLDFCRSAPDGETTAWSRGEVIAAAPDNPSRRRDAVRIKFYGECGHNWHLDIVQHKGETFAFWRVSEDELAEMSYRDYLRTPAWQERRHEALRAAGGRCQLCNSATRLEVHHRTYERRGRELPEDLTVLCAGCHGKFHDAPDRGVKPSGVLRSR